MMDTGRIRFFEAEQQRLVYCAEQLSVLCANCCDTDDRAVVRDLLKEMLARLDMWDALRDGRYDCCCSQEEREMLNGY